MTLGWIRRLQFELKHGGYVSSSDSGGRRVFSPVPLGCADESSMTKLLCACEETLSDQTVFFQTAATLCETTSKRRQTRRLLVACGVQRIKSLLAILRFRA